MTLDATGKDVDFLVIPADAPADINFIATIGGKQYAATVTPGEALAQGLNHTYTLTLSAAGMKVSTVDVTPWGDGQTGSDELKPIIPSIIKVYAMLETGELVDYTTADNTAKGVVLHATGMNFDKKFMIAKNDATYNGSKYALYYDYDKGDLSLNNYQKVDGTNNSGYLPKPNGTFAGSTHLSDDFTTWTAGALSDFNGKSNTEVIAASSNSSMDMCNVLENFNAGTNTATYGDNQGHNDWYVPAFGQLALMFLAKTDIEAAFNKIGYSNTMSAYYMSSTEKDANYTFIISFSNGMISSDSKGTGGELNGARVRFIRDIN